MALFCAALGCTPAPAPLDFSVGLDFSGLGQDGGGPPPDLAAGAGAVTAIAAKGSVTCALYQGGSVRCAGVNNQAEFGGGGGHTEGSSATPVDVGVTSATAIAVGGRHACAVVAGGAVACWGGDDVGQLGGPAASMCSMGPCSHVPVMVAGVTGATAVAAGLQHSCALLGSGGVVCWGDDASGQLGDGNTKPSQTPVAVKGVTGATAISAGDNQTCVLANGTVMCWGWNAFGVLGNGLTTGMPSTAAAATGLGQATAVAAGTSDSCALVGGVVWCWGRDLYDELGGGQPAQCPNNVPCNPKPMMVPGAPPSTGIAVGTGWTMALAADGSASTWGINAVGQLGHATTMSCFGSVPCGGKPTPVDGVAGATQVAAGWRHGCALVPAQGVLCWGDNSYGALGTPSQAMSGPSKSLF